MQLRNLAITVLGGIALLGLSGCAHYRARPLRPLIVDPKKASEPSISFDYEVYNMSDCKRYLDRNVLVHGYQPIQITFANNTDHYFTVSPQTFSFNLISPQEVAFAVHTNTVGRAVGYGVAGLFIWPFLIPAIVDGCGSAKANEQLDADFAHKVLRGQTVRPHGNANGLVFVACEDFDGEFSFTVTDQKDNTNYILSTARPTLQI